MGKVNYMLGFLGVLSVAAAWDGFRRYLQVRTFNQAILDRQDKIERDHEEIDRRVKNVSEKLALQLGSNVSSMRNRGAMR